MLLVLTVILTTLSIVKMPVGVAMQRPAAAEDALDEGRRQFRRGEFFRALEAFRKANTLSGGRCADCLIGMADAMLSMKAYPNALETAQAAFDAAPDSPSLQARAHGIRAQVFLAEASSNPSRFVEAEEAFRKALAFDDTNEDLHFGLGTVLIKLGRNDEGVVELKKFLDIRDIGPTADDARAMIADPRRGRQQFVPAFSLVTVGGARISDESLRGKVVLYDFWATWCPPCVDAVPALRKLQEKYKGTDLVVLSISADEDEGAWRRFTAKNNMTWAQFYDRRREIVGKFRVPGFPTYVLADREGVERMRISGDGFNRSQNLAAAIDVELARPH